MDLQIRVRKQILTCRQTVIAGSVNFVKAKFMFDDEWLGTEIHVIFSNGDIPEKEIILDNTLECIVPWEVLETEGDLYVSAVGLLDGDVRISTKLMDNPITIYPRGSMGGSDPLPPTPTIWDALKSDWNENDPNKASYVKNRTHYKESIERDYTVLPNVELDPTFEVMSYGKKLGLEIGKEYTVDIYASDGNIQTIQTVVIESTLKDVGIEGAPFISNEYFALTDGAAHDIESGELIFADDCLYTFNDGNIEKIVINALSSIETIIHKIPNEYLPKTDQTYSATSENAQSGLAVAEALENKPITKVDTLIVENAEEGLYLTKEVKHNENLLYFSSSAFLVLIIEFIALIGEQPQKEAILFTNNEIFKFANGVRSAFFDTSITANSINAPTTQAVKNYVDNRIGSGYEYVTILNTTLSEEVTTIDIDKIGDKTLNCIEFYAQLDVPNTSSATAIGFNVKRIDNSYQGVTTELSTLKTTTDSTKHTLVAVKFTQNGSIFWNSFFGGQIANKNISWNNSYPSVAIYTHSGSSNNINADGTTGIRIRGLFPSGTIVKVYGKCKLA